MVALRTSNGESNNRLLFLIVILFVLAGCDASGNTPAPDRAPEFTDAEGLPIIRLPAVDFGTTCASAMEEAFPVGLGSTLPATSFLVEFQGRRAPGKGHFRAAIVAVQQRRPDGKLVHIALGSVAPQGELDQDVVAYKGVCPQPASRGPCIIEVRVIGKSYLVRSTEVK